MKKINFKKISAIGAAILLTGMSMGGAFAANYPNPFVVGGSANVAIVYGTGTGVSSLDLVQAGNIQSSLQSYMGESGVTTASVSGEAASLASGADYIYLMDELNEEVSVITDDDLPTVLADGTFTDDDGTNYNFEQTIDVLGGAQFVFDDSDNDLDDPALIINMTTTETTGVYNLSVVFEDAVNFTAAESEGEIITLFGNTYTVGTATDDDTLVLLGGSGSNRIDVGETATVTVGDESYEVTLNAISDATTAEASVTVDGETKKFTEGQTKSFADGDVDVFAETVFRTGDNAGYVEIQLGADKLTLEDGNDVLTGSDDDVVDGTLVYLKGTATTECQDLTELVIAVDAPDNDENHIGIGESFIDPVFGSLKLNFASVINGPVITDMEDASSSRYTLEVGIAGNQELTITATNSNGYTETIPFTYQNVTQDDNSDAIELYEGANLSEDEYFVLNSGNYQHFMELTKVDIDGSGYVTVRDLFTGESYSTTSGHNWTLDGTETLTISGQTYTVENNTAFGATDGAVTITSSDWNHGYDGSVIAVYPYIELVSGEEHRFTITDNVVVLTNFSSNDTHEVDLELPTGTLSNITGSVAAGADGTADTIYIDDSSVAVGANVNKTVGTVVYNFAVAQDATAAVANITQVSVSVVGIPSVDGPDANGIGWDGPGLLFVEEEDKQDATVTDKNAVIVRTSDTGTYSTVLAPEFTGSDNNNAFDDSDYTGYIDAFGTYVLFDSADSNQESATLTYPKNQMYAEVFFAESSATISGGVSGGATALGSVLVKDTEVSDVSSKNLIVVGGSCINSAAATLVGGAYCSADWTTATGVGSGEFLIKSYSSSSISDGIALLVAGYEAADTVNAATYLRTQIVDTSKEYKGTSSTSAELVTAA